MILNSARMYEVIRSWKVLNSILTSGIDKENNKISIGECINILNCVTLTKFISILGF